MFVKTPYASRDAADQSYVGIVSQKDEYEDIIRTNQSVNYLLDNLCSSEKDPTRNCIDFKSD